MFKISYSANLKWEINISWSKNAALPIVSANYCYDNKINLLNQPDIIDLHVLKEIAESSLQRSTNYFDLTDKKATKIRSSILLIPLWLLKYWEVRFLWSGWCKIGKRPLDAFDDWLRQAWIQITNDDFKTYKVIGKPKKNIMLPQFSVTGTESLLTYLAFLDNIDYEINIFQIAIEPHVINLINYLKNLWVEINLRHDHSISIKPWIKQPINNEFKIIWDYIEAWTYFAIWAWADNSEIVIKNCNVDDLSSLYGVATKIGINFKVIDKKTLSVNSYNKANYNPVKIETRTYPWFPTDLQSIYATLLTQANGISKIFETMFEWRYSYLTELENLGANIEILNPHQVLIIWPTKLQGAYVSSTDLRWWWAMILAWIMAEWETFITKEDIILRWYENIENKLKLVGVDIQKL